MWSGATLVEAYSLYDGFDKYKYKWEKQSRYH